MNFRRPISFQIDNFCRPPSPDVSKGAEFTRSSDQAAGEPETDAAVIAASQSGTKITT